MHGPLTPASYPLAPSSASSPSWPVISTISSVRLTLSPACSFIERLVLGVVRCALWPRGPCACRVSGGDVSCLFVDLPTHRLGFLGHDGCRQTSVSLPSSSWLLTVAIRLISSSVSFVAGRSQPFRKFSALSRLTFRLLQPLILIHDTSQCSAAVDSLALLLVLDFLALL